MSDPIVFASPAGTVTLLFQGQCAVYGERHPAVQAEHPGHHQVVHRQASQQPPPPPQPLVRQDTRTKYLNLNRLVKTYIVPCVLEVPSICIQ